MLATCTCTTFALDDPFPPVENVTVTNVGPTSFTVQWNVSSYQLLFEGWDNLSQIILDSLLLQRYNFSSGLYQRAYQLRYVDSRGYSRLRTISSFFSSTPPNQYSVTSLSFGEVYNVSVRVRVRVISSCYSYIYGEYSDPLPVETVETGKRESDRDLFDTICKPCST